jgi:hypothetical protein
MQSAIKKSKKMPYWNQERRAEQRASSTLHEKSYLINTVESKLIEMRTKVELWKANTKKKKSLANLAYMAGLTEPL